MMLPSKKGIIIFFFRKPILVSEFVEGVRSRKIPEKNEFEKLINADTKYNVFQKTNSEGKKYSSGKNGSMNRCFIRITVKYLSKIGVNNVQLFIF